MEDCMENKNNVVIVLLVILIGLVSGVGLLIGIGNAIGVAMGPLNAKLEAIEKEQKSIEAKLNSQEGGSIPVADIQRQLAQIQNRIGAGAGAQQQQPQMPPSEDMNKVYDIPV